MLDRIATAKKSQSVTKAVGTPKLGNLSLFEWPEGQCMLLSAATPDALSWQIRGGGFDRGPCLLLCACFIEAICHLELRTVFVVVNIVDSLGLLAGRINF